MFGHLPITFDSRVLRPREWTVTQSIWAAELLRQAPRPTHVLELCAGAGQIGLLSLALSAPAAHRLVAVDLSPAACAFARRNAEAVGLKDQVEVREGPMDEVLYADERFELVIADPPWVERYRVPLFPDDPVVAIDGGIDGLDLALACVRIAERHLMDGGSLLLQLGTQYQTECIREDLRQRFTRLTAVDVWLEPAAGALLHVRKQRC
jgi:release factor glutamine methyltransferase